MSIPSSIKSIQKELEGYHCRLVAVSKTHENDAIQEAYDAGQRLFGENKVQELIPKHEALPKDIEWHMIGHLQSNKVKYIAPFIHCIHSVDSLKLLKEINKEAAKNNRNINCFLQIYIAMEETKFGLDHKEVKALINSEEFQSLKNISITGLMGMASNTDNMEQVRKEFKGLKNLFDQLKTEYHTDNIQLQELSMGMTHDYKIAIEEGSTLVRIGSAIFGNRNYL